MKFAYQLSNLFGTVYKSGNIIFTSDGNCVISPVGNRVTIFDLVNHTTKTLPIENARNIRLLSLAPQGDLLFSVDEEGGAILINIKREVVLAHINFKAKVKCLKFDPTGKLFAVGKDKKVQIWKAPPKFKEFSPFRLLKTIGRHTQEITCMDWSSDSKFLVTGGRDHSVIINPIFGGQPITFSAHRNQIIGCFFAKGDRTVYSVSKDGAVYVWEHLKVGETDEVPNIARKSENFKWQLTHRHYCLQHSPVTSCSFQKETNLLVISYKNGVFGLYLMPDFSTAHTLSITQNRINTCAISQTGDWLAFGSKKLGQLLVWEWQSETYVLKQQGHYFDMNSAAYSPDGQLIITGSDDGKVKAWNSRTGYCFVTFDEHIAPVSAVAFSPKGSGHAIFSASLDGTVRAYDLIRYRNFRTFTSPEPTQFSCLAIDPSGDIVCAGSVDAFNIYVWSIQTGKLLDVLSGHEGPISALSFNPIQPVLASCSWDGSLRTWEIFSGNQTEESLNHSCEIIAMAYRPDGKQVCTSTMDGQLNFWDPDNGTLTSTIEGRKDISGGRLIGQAKTAKNSEHGKHFTTVCYSADGQCILAGGNSKYICIYHIGQKILIKRYQISYNLSLDGILDYLSTKFLTQGGPIDLIDHNDSDDDEPFRKNYAPGAQKGSLSRRNTRVMARTKCVQFSPTGRSFVAASTEGLLIYSLDETLIFDPFELDIDVTPDNIRKVLAEKLYLKALIMSFQLNEIEIISEVFHTIPGEEIHLVAHGIPNNYLSKVLSFLAKSMYKTPHIEFHLLWCLHLFQHHGSLIKSDGNLFITALRDLQKNISNEQRDLSSICNENKFTLDYLRAVGAHMKFDETDETNLSDLLRLKDPFNPFSADSNLSIDFGTGKRKNREN